MTRDEQVTMRMARMELNLALNYVQNAQELVGGIPDPGLREWTKWRDDFDAATAALVVLVSLAGKSLAAGDDAT